MRNGEFPIYEPGFDRAIGEGRPKFATDLDEAFRTSEIIFLFLPTPPGANGRADLNFVLNVADELGGICLVNTRSTGWWLIRVLYLLERLIKYTRKDYL